MCYGDVDGVGCIEFGFFGFVFLDWYGGDDFVGVEDFYCVEGCVVLV